MMDILEAMRVRRSARTYTGAPVPVELRDRMIEAFDRSDRLNDLALRLDCRPGDEVGPAMTGLVGSYGAIKNPPHYFIGVSENGDGDQTNFGFAMEQMILECTRAGLGTCWVGGFFKKSLLDRAVPKSADERIICITPVGYATARRMAERTMRSMGGLNVRVPLAERVFFRKWGEDASGCLAETPALKEAFMLTRWAPSASNAQPCHYVFDDERIVIATLADKSSRYMGLLGRDRAEGLDFKGVDAGIAMAHVHLAARELGLGGKWSLRFDEAAIRSQYRIDPYARIVGTFEFD